MVTGEASPTIQNAAHPSRAPKRRASARAANAQATAPAMGTSNASRYPPRA